MRTRRYQAMLLAPISPAGRLLTWRWDALPALLEALDDRDLTPRKRAWVLGLLYSVTGQNDPRSSIWGGGPSEEGILPAHRWVSGPWHVSGGPAGEAPTFGVLDASSSGSHRGTIDVERQVRFAQRWTAWKRGIVVVDGELGE